MKFQGDYEAECKALAIFLVHPEAIHESETSNEHFSFPETRAVFDVLLDLNADGISFTDSAICTRIEEKGYVDRMGGENAIRAFISELWDLSFTSKVLLPENVHRIKDARVKFLIHNFVDKTLTDFQSKRPMSEILTDWNIFTAANLGDNRDPYITRLAKEYIEAQDGNFHVHDVERFAGANGVRDKKAILMLMSRMVKHKHLDHNGSERSGIYRKVNAECEVIDINAPPSKPLDLRLPFGLERFVYTINKNIIVIAGSPDAGKTCLLLNIAKLNLSKHDIWYYSSEMSQDEFRIRLQNFKNLDGSPVPMDMWQKMNIRERVVNFQDVIKPDDINIIDYLEMSDNFFRLGGMLAAIHHKLQKGVAIIAIQKSRKSELGRGSEFGLEKPRLYLTVDSERPGARLKVVKAKNWVNAGTNPNGLSIKFKIIGGANLHYEDPGWIFPDKGGAVERTIP